MIKDHIKKTLRVQGCAKLINPDSVLIYNKINEQIYWNKKTSCGQFAEKRPTWWKKASTAVARAGLGFANPSWARPILIISLNYPRPYISSGLVWWLQKYICYYKSFSVNNNNKKKTKRHHSFVIFYCGIGELS